MSTSIQKEVINVKAIETINKTVFTTRRLLKTNPEQDYNIVSGDVDNDIKRESDDFESESENDEYESDSELSITDDFFPFESDQSDSDNEFKNVVEQNYVYHDNINNSDEFSKCTGLQIIQSGRVSNFKKRTYWTIPLIYT